MQFILNIGLDSQATGTIAAHVAREIVAANGLIINRWTVLESDTEPTLVVEVSDFALPVPTDFYRAVFQTASDLRQDCIALYHPTTGRGALIGERAAEWGKFNPEFFFLIDGARLARSTGAPHVADRQAALNAYAASRGAAC